ncbi:MAG: DUF4160 domain-containing protein [Accumulibacter sp.]
MTSARLPRRSFLRVAASSNERHNLPHVHAKYQGQDASFSIADCEVLAGAIPAAKARLVQAWIEIHREELMADWALAISGEPPFRIDPLR